MLQHRLNRDDVRVNLTPRQRLNCCIDNVGAIVADFQNTCHRQTWARVAVILNNNIRMACLDGLSQRTEQCGLTNTCHILQTDFLCTGSNNLVGNVGIILNCMYRRSRDTKGSLWGHACSLSPFYRRNDVTNIVQTAEDTCDIHALSMLYLIHQRTHIIGYRVHAQRVQTAVKHVCLNTHLIEWLTESADGSIGVLACQQVHLLKGTTIGLYTVEHAHVDDGGGNTL